MPITSGTAERRQPRGSYPRRRPLVVFAALSARFDACLLTDAEMATGPEHWTTWDNPFRDWP